MTRPDMKRSIAALIAVGFVAVALHGCSRAPRTAQEVLERSVAAHGGEKLSAWETLTIRGTVEMQDGITYRAAYLLLARQPGKLRVEQDMTAARGRIFHEYFLNDDVAWSRRNLIPGRGDTARMQRWMNQCFGIAYFARFADAFALEEDAEAEWREKGDDDEAAYTVTERRPAWVLSGKVGDEVVRLYVDKKTFHLLQEETEAGTRLFADFKKFGDVVMPARVLEITAGRQGEVVTPYTYETVAYNEAIEEWMFTEDMPATNR
jgi:hypothetical protein